MTPPSSPSGRSAVPAVRAAGVRAAWTDLPSRVRGGIEALLGSPVVEVVNQEGGFSPGLAARIRCADGRRAFVKAVGTALNEESPRIHRAEADIARRLPSTAPVPHFHGAYDDGDWVALVFDEIDGRIPHTPWRADELERVVAAVTAMSRSLTPCPVPGARTAADAIGPVMRSYQNLATERPDDLIPWERRNVDALAEIAASSVDHLGGDTLVHFDLRADNILLSADAVWFVDWPWAFRGAAWIDLVMLMINVALHGSDPEPYLAGHPLLHDVPPEVVTGFLAGVAGFFAAAARLPPPAGLPTVRRFQRAQHVTTLDWVRRRTAWV